MSNFTPNSSFDGGSNSTYLIRWRGLQYGPFSAATIEEKLATNQLSLLHEISYNGRWMTLRDFVAEREAINRAERLAEENQQRRVREEAERKARDEEWQIQEEADRQLLVRREQNHRGSLAVQGTRSHQMEARPVRYSHESFTQTRSMNLKPHRGGLILTLGIVGFCCLGFLAIPAWVMGTTDLGEMDAGLMDDSGRGRTRFGQVLGILGTIWLAFLVFVITFGDF